MCYSYLFSDSQIENLFGSLVDERGLDYRSVYSFELRDIESIIERRKNCYSSSELSILLHFLLSECFGDTLNNDSEVYVSIIKDYLFLEWEGGFKV